MPVSKLFAQAMGWDDALPAAVAALQLLAFGRRWANRQMSRHGNSPSNVASPMSGGAALDGNASSSASAAAASASSVSLSPPSALPAVVSSPGSSASASSAVTDNDAAAVAAPPNFAPPSAADVRLIQFVEASTQQLYALMEAALKSTDPTVSGMASSDQKSTIFTLFYRVSV